MLIKGVTGGKEKGNPIEYSPAEKFPLAVAKFIKDQAPEGQMYLFSKAEITDSNHGSNGPSTNGFANNSYSASGKVWYKVLEVATDRLYPETSTTFELEFTDSTDELGVPDIKATKFILH